MGTGDLSNFTRLMQEYYFLRKWSSDATPLAGVWDCRGGAYPITGRFFIKQTGPSRLEGFVDNEANSIRGNTVEDTVEGVRKRNLDFIVQWAKGDITYVGFRLNDKEDRLNMQGELTPVGRTHQLSFPYLHDSLVKTDDIANTETDYESSGGTGKLMKKHYSEAQHSLFHKVLNNMERISHLYPSIGFRDLAKIFRTEDTTAETIAGVAIASGVVNGYIDQMNASVTFESEPVLTQFNNQVGKLCSKIQSTCEKILAAHPGLAKGTSTER